MFLEDGRDITKLPDKERDRLRRVDMAFVFQSVALISTMTAFENVEFALRLTKLPYKERVACPAEPDPGGFGEKNESPSRRDVRR